MWLFSWGTKLFVLLSLGTVFCVTLIHDVACDYNAGFLLTFLIPWFRDAAAVGCCPGAVSDFTYLASWLVCQIGQETHQHKQNWRETDCSCAAAGEGRKANCSCGMILLKHSSSQLGQFCPLGILSNVWRHFWWSQLGMWYYWHLVRGLVWY